jgi:hypothetical protein
MSTINIGSGTDYFVDLEKGNQDDLPLIKSGMVSSLSTSFITVWPENAAYSFPSSASQMTVSSDDANDTSAGSGARSVLITYLDASYENQTELVTLNGTTAVNTVATNILRIQNIVVATGATNAGKIYIGTGTVTGGVPANIYDMIPVGRSASNSAFFTVPSGYTAFPKGFRTACKSTQEIETRVVVEKSGITFIRGGAFLQGAGALVEFSFSAGIPEESDISFQARSLSGTSDVFTHMEFILSPNS